MLAVADLERSLAFYRTAWAYKRSSASDVRTGTQHRFRRRRVRDFRVYDPPEGEFPADFEFQEELAAVDEYREAGESCMLRRRRRLSSTVLSASRVGA